MGNVVNVQPASARRPAASAQLVAVLASAVVTAASYLLWLGWHEQKHLQPGTLHEVGPHEAWQVVGLALTLGAFTAIGGWLRLVQPTVWATAFAVTFIFSLEAHTQHDQDASMWPVGAAMLLVAALLGLSVVAVVFRSLRSGVSALHARRLRNTA
jgi:hypothetical protein